MNYVKKAAVLLLVLLISLTLLAGCTPVGSEPDKSASQTVFAAGTTAALDENGIFSKKDDVALYIHLYSRLPGNYISKIEARKLGWTGGTLSAYAPGKNIGGDIFGNYERLLPEKKGRVYRECDIGTTDTASSRGAKRIVYSSDGLIYYTGDHYESFALLYGGNGL